MGGRIEKVEVLIGDRYKVLMDDLGFTLYKFNEIYNRRTKQTREDWQLFSTPYPNSWKRIFTLIRKDLALDKSKKRLESNNTLSIELKEYVQFFKEADSEAKEMFKCIDELKV